MAWSVLQSVLGTVAGSGNCTATFTANLSSGSKLIAYVSIDSNVTTVPTSVKDGAGNSFTAGPSVAYPSATGGLSVWFLDTPAGDVGTKPTITATNGTNFGCVIGVEEVSGLQAGNTTAVLDGTAATATGTASPAAVSGYSSTAANEYLTGVAGDAGFNTTYTLTGYTQERQTAANTAAQLAWGDKNSSNGSESFSWPISAATTWGGILVAFKLAAAGAAPAPGAAPQQALSLLWSMRTQVPQQAQAPAPPPPLPAPSQGAALLQRGLPQSPQSPQVPQPPPPGPAPAQSPALLQRGQATQPQSVAVPGAPPVGPAPQQGTSLLRQGLPQSAPSPQAAPAPPPGQQPQNAGALLAQGLAQQPQYSQQPAPPPPITQPEQSPALVQRGTATPGNFAQAPAVVVAPPPSPAGNGQQGTGLLRLALPQQQAAAQQAAPAPPGPAPQQSAALVQRGTPTPGHFSQAPAVIAPVIAQPGQQQSVLLLQQGRPVPGSFFQQPPVVVVAAQPAQAQPQALSLLQFRLPVQAGVTAGPAFTIGALTASDAPSGVLAAAGAASALTAATAPSGTLTATDQRTGGPN